MIAALYSSRTKGSKKLTLDGVEFGWRTIEKNLQSRDDTSRARSQSQCTWPEICICVQSQWDPSQCKTSQDHAGA